MMTDSTSKTSNRPLVTFALFAYNQEEFIREAVNGAFAQTYSPLELIISDDCSSDRTFEIMEELVDGYSGNHRVILNKTNSNSGLACHLRSVANLASGELLVLAAGDDISVPERVTALVTAWARTGLGDVSIYSGAIPVNAKGLPITTGYSFSQKAPAHYCCIEDVIKNDDCAVLGATQAVTKALIAEFPEIEEKVFREDNILPFRALLRDGIVFIEESLVKYRHHDKNIVSRISPAAKVTRGHRIARLVKDYEDKLATRIQWAVDLKSQENISCRNDLLAKLKKLIVIRKYQLKVAESNFLSSIFWIVFLTLITGKARGLNIFLYKYTGRNFNQFAHLARIVRDKIWRREDHRKFNLNLRLANSIKLSFCICTYNGQDRLKNVFEALARQTVANTEWEVLVIDNASTDGSGEVAAKLIEEYLNGFGRVVREETPGLSHARCRGAHEAHGEIICFLDDDNVPALNLAESITKAFSERPHAGVIGGKVIPRWEEEPTNLAKMVAPFALAICDLGDIAKRIDHLGGGIVGAGLCVRADLLRLIFDLTILSNTVSDRTGSSLISGGDLAISIAARQLGWECWYVPSLQIEHLLPGTRMNIHYLRRLYEGIGRGQAATRKMYDWKARSPLNLLIGLKDLCRWTIGEWKGTPQEFRENNDHCLAEDLHALNQHLILGRAKEALKLLTII